MFTHGQLVRLKVAPKLTFVVIEITHDSFDAYAAVRTSYLIRHRLDTGHKVEFPVSEHEIEAVPTLSDWTRRNCGASLPGSELVCNCGGGTKPESIDIEDGRAATVQATIHADARRRGTEQVARIRDDIAKAKAAPLVTPGIRADGVVVGGDSISLDSVGKPDAEFAGTLQVLPLEWVDHASESETKCGKYHATQEKTGWAGAFFGDDSETWPLLESDKPHYATREEAKAWCERHASGEELEPRRCERCKMPREFEECLICKACADVQAGKPVAIPTGYVTPEF